MNMTNDEKKECKDNGYTLDFLGNMGECDGKCEQCILSYDYVLGYSAGYHNASNDCGY